MKEVHPIELNEKELEHIDSLVKTMTSCRDMNDYVRQALNLFEVFNNKPVEVRIQIMELLRK
jgi:hypothetical protein